MEKIVYLKFSARKSPSKGVELIETQFEYI